MGVGSVVQLLADLDAAPSDRAQPEDRLGQLALPVPRHAGDADDLAAVHSEVEVLHRQVAAIADDVEVAHRELGSTDRLRIDACG